MLRWSILISLYGLNLISNPIKCWNIVSAPSRVSSPARLKEMTPYCASEAADGKVQRASISQPTSLRCAYLDINLKRTNIESGGRPTLTSCKWYEMSRKEKNFFALSPDGKLSAPWTALWLCPWFNSLLAPAWYRNLSYESLTSQFALVMCPWWAKRGSCWSAIFLFHNLCIPVCQSSTRRHLVETQNSHLSSSCHDCLIFSCCTA